ncbi:hypothetical protein CDV53_20695 [Haematobacter missouriensis]|uniref:Transposase InsH N-terminal domain-containing protein n=1 Tax=Haematobacter missouriensis TaxID=366616 RepID=A0ABX3ZMV3_9RHOB|nr:hypothetical protein CDV53_20695 [Haematobacter missouriensis]
MRKITNPLCIFKSFQVVFFNKTRGCRSVHDFAHPGRRDNPLASRRARPAARIFSAIRISWPAHHPLRKIRQAANDALTSLNADVDAVYIDFVRPSIAPERLIRASLIQIPFSIRSERQLMERMQYNLLFRWFVGLGIDPVWVLTVFTKNRDRLLNIEMSRKVMAAILAHCEVKPPLSDDHFSVDGTLVKAWALMKSFWPKAERPAVR